METAAAALQKMRDGDFSGARELAVAAQRLGMEGFDQMITVCNVHCAGKDDWYKILDVAADSDEGAVKRQYGRMAVALHPDKNGLPGAREAFELIVEAKAVIGDVEKRMAYDTVCRAGAIADQRCFGFSKFQDNHESYGFSKFQVNQESYGFSKFQVNQESYGFSKFRDSQESCGFSRFQGVGLKDDDGVEILDFGVSRVLNDKKVELGGNGLFEFGWTNGVNGVSCGRGRGRARVNKENNDVTSIVLDEESGVVGVKRGRGRPRGLGSKADAAPKRPRGRPPGSGRGRGRGRGRSSNVEVSSQDEGCNKSKESHSQTASEADRSKDSHCRIRPDSEMLEYTDAEFHDFEQERSRECFKTGQVWAVYDTLDAMPRFYAVINAILDDGHRLEITWLEPLPEDEEEKRWLYRGLPASSGRFKQGYSEVIQGHGVFSHLVKWKRDAILKKVYAIRPQKGETWAVFKKWEGLGSSEGMRFGEAVEYAVVEIMSDYDGERGVSVGVLGRVEGYGSVFGRKEGKGEVIGAKDRLRLSHKIPSVSVCVGDMSFFELDPGSLPITA
ncbi:hypothetical protein AAHA92_27736 [Salvia divinorum]|uniref:J domain-containing protein n=1 Tax=Salvia divinorum TaxID=28513 RepID=A0ABD1G4M3_SALDI